MDTTPFTPIAPAPVLGFLSVHAALRRDCADLVAASIAREPLDDRLALFDRVIGAHHHGEDAVLLPLLRSREPAITDVSERVEEQHVRLDAAIHRLRAIAADRRTDVDGIVALAELLEDHLSLEEQRILPVWVASLSPADHEQFGRRLRRATPWRDIAVVVPWLLDAVPDSFRPIAEGELPAPVRFAYCHVLRHRFERKWNRPSATLRLQA
jgi:hypothetical protein